MNETDRIALVRKPIGDSALELLVALRDENIVLYEKKGVPGLPRRNDENFRFLSLDKLRDRECVVNPYVIKRLDEVLTALENRRYISKVNLNYWLCENPEYREEIAFQAVTTQMNLEDFVFEITDYGLDALRHMAVRVSNFYSNRDKIKDHLIITKNLSDDWAELGGVRRIYRVMKETARNYIVAHVNHERRGINNDYYYGGDWAIEKTVRVEENNYLIIPKDFVAVHHADLEQFYRLVEQTQALDAVLKGDEEDMEKELAPIIEKYHTISKQRMERLRLIVEQSDQSSTAVRKQPLQTEGFVLEENEIDQELSQIGLNI